MRQFKTSFDGITVDLDDPHTYDHLPKDTKQLDDKMFCEIGMALCYMNIWHPEIFKRKERDDMKIVGDQQRKRVKKLIKYFCDERKNHYDDILWLQEQIFLFQDEIENMC